MMDALHFVFDSFPGPQGARFIEVETPDGRSIDAGEWCSRPDGFSELRVNLAALAWQPIQTAPKDGRQVLIVGGRFTYDDDWTSAPFLGVAIALWVSNSHSPMGGGWQGENNGGHDQWNWHQPTHWQPLPDVPVHASDCAVHNEPAMPNGPSDEDEDKEDA